MFTFCDNVFNAYLLVTGMRRHLQRLKIDPDALKPEGWLDDEPEFVADPNAEKPEDW